MEDFIYRLVERMHFDASSMSRNRNFHSFADPAGWRAYRISRHLRSLERDLLEYGDPATLNIRMTTNGRHIFLLRLEIPRLKGRRISYLRAREFSILCRSPKVAGLLRQALI